MAKRSRQISVDDQTDRWLVDLAKQKGVTVSGLVRDLVRDVMMATERGQSQVARPVRELSPDDPGLRKVLAQANEILAIRAANRARQKR